MGVEIEIARQASDELVESIRRLMPQLSSTAPPGGSIVRQILACEANTVLVARLEGEIVGMLTLVRVPLLSGMRARIEDVVVDAEARGQGVGALLTQEALRLARAAGARTVDLTSRPSRQAANRLYERLGFQSRDSKVYRFSVSEDPGLQQHESPSSPGEATTPDLKGELPDAVAFE